MASVRSFAPRGLVGAAALVLGGLTAESARAAEPSAADKETSRGLYRDGMRLLDARDYAGAERACRGAHALVQAPTSTACWARSLEGLGRLIEARDAFLEVSRYPALAGEPAVFTSARDAARAEAEALAARIPTVVLVVSGVADSTPLSATVDGAPIAADTVRLPRKIDPGPHVVIVEAPGAQPVRVDVNALEGHSAQVRVALSVTSEAAISPAPGAASSPEGPRAAQAHTPWPMIAALGVGAAGVAVGVGAALAADSKDSSLAAECTGSRCPPSARGDLDSFHSLATLSTVGYVVGAVGVVAGGALWLLRPHAASATSARLWIGPASSGVTGTF